MRWFWIDRFTEFVSGQFAVSTKSVSLGEQHLHGHYDSYPMLPHSIVVEGMAQTAGLLMGESTQYTARIVLAKIAKARFYFPARPGDTLTYRTVIENQSAEGVLFRGTSKVGEQLQAEVEFFLAILGEKHGGQQLFEPGNLGRLLRVLRVYDVGKSVGGEPLVMPPSILELERGTARRALHET